MLLGVIITELPVSEFLMQRKTWGYLRNLFPFNVAYELPGVFHENPFPVVNGVYWTLTLELLCYLGVAILGRTGLLRGGVLLSLAAILLLWRATTEVDAERFLHMRVHLVSLYSAYFCMGSAYFLYRSKIPLTPGFFFLALALIVAAAAFPGGKWALFLTLPYIVVYLAHSPLPLQNFGQYGDFSYGLYLYGFPVQQLLIMTVKGVGPLTLFVLSAPVALLFAIASWHLIEKPALERKGIHRAAY